MTFQTDNLAAAGAFLSRQLEQRLPKVYEKKFPALPFANGQLLPATANLGAGVESIVEEVANYVGGIQDDIASDIDNIPLADANIAEFKFPVVVKPVAIRYSIRELEAARYANRDIRGMREMAARRKIEEEINILAAYGDARRAVRGMLNDPNVPVVNTLTSSLYDPLVTSADALKDYITAQATKIVTDGNMTSGDLNLLVPVRLHERLTNERLGDTGMTVKRFILENNLWIKSITPCNELSSALLERYGVHTPGTNKDAMFFYSRDPETVERLYEPLTVIPPQIRGLHYIVIMFVATTGAIWHYPQNALRVDIPRAV